MIFVTGGTGFLGRHLIPALCRDGLTIKVLTRTPEQHTWLNQYPRVHIVKGDLSDADLLMEAVQGCEYIIHAGGLFRFWGDEANFMRTNTQGTHNILTAASSIPLKRFIHISTIAVIGTPHPTDVMDETYPPHPTDPYQKSKLEGEQDALRFHREKNVPVIVLRPGAFYGELGEYAFNRLFFRDPMRGIIMQMNRGRYITFPAYIGDVVQGIMLAMTNGRVGEIYHICGDWMTHKQVFDIVCAEAKLWYPRPPIPGWVGINASRFLEFIAKITNREPFWPLNLKSYVYNYWRVSNQKARDELGFIPTPFIEGAKRTVEWYKKRQPTDIPQTRC